MLELPRRPIGDIHFFQDPTYPDLLEGTGWDAEHLHFERQGREIGGAVFMKRKLRIFPAHVRMVLFGPKLTDATPENLRHVLTELRDRARKERSLYVAVQPYLPGTGDPGRELTALGYNLHPGYILYHHTVRVDLSPGEDTVFQSFKDTLRRALRKAEKSGVTVEINSGPDAVEDFYRLYQETHQRSHGGYQRRDFFQKSWDLLGRHNEILFAISRVEGKPAAAAMAVLVDGNMIYLAGGSTSEETLLQARPNEYLHWQLIRTAKTWGCRCYDLGGVSPGAPEGSKSSGIAQFKTKFASGVVPLPGFYRLDLRPLLARGIDRVIPVARKVRECFFRSEESDYNLM